MEEFIDIVTREGKATGQSAAKSEIHQKGHYHHTIHLWLYTDKGEVLLQQRAATKAICPLLWDVSVAGHIDAGETVFEAAIRETKEEIGLTITAQELIKVGVFECFQSYNNGIIDNEFHNTFIGQLLVPLEKLVPQKDEVEALKLVSIEEFKTLLNNSASNNHFVATNYDYYHEVLKAIIVNLKS